MQRRKNDPFGSGSNSQPIAEPYVFELVAEDNEAIEMLMPGKVALIFAGINAIGDQVRRVQSFGALGVLSGSAYRKP
jgi:hypothetical protein